MISGVVKAIRDALITANITGIGTNIKAGILENELDRISMKPCTVIEASGETIDTLILSNTTPSDRTAIINVHFIDLILSDATTPAVVGDKYLTFLDNVELLTNALLTNTTIKAAFDIDNNIKKEFASNQDLNMWVSTITIEVKKIS